MKRWALTIAAGPTYRSFPQNGGQAVVQQAQRMHLVVSSNRALFGRLKSLGGRRRIVVDQVGHDRLVMIEERLHVDDQVLDHRQAEDRLDGHHVGSQRTDQGLAGQLVGAVDSHGVGAADPVRARATQAQRIVLAVLDLQEHIEDAVHRIGGQFELLPARRGVALGIIPLDPDRQIPQAMLGRRGAHEGLPAFSAVDSLASAYAAISAGVLVKRNSIHLWSSSSSVS